MPRHYSINRVPLVLGALLFGLGVLGLGFRIPVNLILLSGFLVLYIKGLPHALQWSIVCGLVFETVSPFPSGVFLASSILSLAITYYVFIHYFTHRTLWGILVGSFFGIVIFEVLLLLLGRIGYLVTPGLLPDVDSAYFRFVLLRVSWSTLMLAVAYRVVRNTAVHTRSIL